MRCAARDADPWEDRLAATCGNVREKAGFARKSVAGCGGNFVTIVVAQCATCSCTTVARCGECFCPIVARCAHLAFPSLIAQTLRSLHAPGQVLLVNQLGPGPRNVRKLNQPKPGRVPKARVEQITNPLASSNAAVP